MDKDEELFDAIDEDQLMAIEVCSQIIESPFVKFPGPKVLVVCGMREDPLYQRQVRLETFSESLSMSVNVPLPQTKVELE